MKQPGNVSASVTHDSLPSLGTRRAVVLLLSLSTVAMYVAGGTAVLLPVVLLAIGLSKQLSDTVPLHPEQLHFLVTCSLCAWTTAVATHSATYYLAPFVGRWEAALRADFPSPAYYTSVVSLNLCIALLGPLLAEQVAEWDRLALTTLLAQVVVFAIWNIRYPSRGKVLNRFLAKAWEDQRLTPRS